MTPPRPEREIDGTTHYQCTKCLDWFTTDGFYYKNDRKSQRYSQCKTCEKYARSRSPDKERQLVLGNLDVPRLLPGWGERYDDCVRYALCLDSAARRSDRYAHCSGTAANETRCRWYVRGKPDLIQIRFGQYEADWPEAMGYE